MKAQRIKPSVSSIRLWSAAFSFLLVGAIPVWGQSTPQSQPVNITNAERARQQEMSKREWQLRNMGVESKQPAIDRKALGAQIEEDFTRILTLHNELVRGFLNDKALGYDFVFEAAGEIRKRASRLQTTLVLPKPESKAQPQKMSREFNEAGNYTAGQMREALTTLCKQIESFVNNPIITTPGTVDANQLDKARQDLADVVELSGNIRKTAEKLKRASPQ